ncbi:MAG: hypothetical protein JWL69_4885, partial [Phycisphaerales bacterium]|nr:hypothetical protein [Phycisphaerales bacterium]
MQMLTRANQSVVEHLESRTLLSAGGTLNPSFGNGGILTGYEVLGVRPDGYLIATRPNGPAALLHPDGSFASNYNGPVTVPVYPPYPPAQLPPLALPGGKYLLIKNNILTRYNSNNTVDTTFGVNGSVSDFITGTGAMSFQLGALVRKGSEILVVGEAYFQPSDSFRYFLVGVAALDANGHRVPGFG